MPQPKLQSLAAARQQIQDMLESMADPESPGFARRSLDRSLRLTHLERADDGKSARIVCEMRVTEPMANHFMNVRPRCPLPPRAVAARVLILLGRCTAAARRASATT